MKLVTAIINPSQVDSVTDALGCLDVDRVVLSEVRCFGDAGPRLVYRGSAFTMPYVTKIRAEVAADDEDVALVVTAITNTDTTGETSVWVAPLEIAYAATVHSGPNAARKVA